MKGLASLSLLFLGIVGLSFENTFNATVLACEVLVPIVIVFILWLFKLSSGLESQPISGLLLFVICSIYYGEYELPLVCYKLSTYNTLFGFLYFAYLIFSDNLLGNRKVEIIINPSLTELQQRTEQNPKYVAERDKRLEETKNILNNCIGIGLDKNGNPIT